MKSRARTRSATKSRTVIAGYHWFTDWGRDTMISLEGLTLTTGRQVEAGYILRTFAHYVRDGLIPNMFPEGGTEGLYHTADATLWFFHADAIAIVECVRRSADARAPVSDAQDDRRVGTSAARAFGIHVDRARRPTARRVREGYQLTWMDAKVDDWVVTPRRGKAGRDQRALVQRAQADGGVGRRTRRRSRRSTAQRAEQVRRSFNERFWYAEGGYLYDVIDTRGGPAPDPQVPAEPDCSRSPCRMRCSIGAAMGTGDAHRARSTADAGRSAIARARTTRTTSRATSAISARAMPPITRGRSGGGSPVRSSTPG